MQTTDFQGVDLDAIRNFFHAIQRGDYNTATVAAAHKIAGMTIELCDLAEGSTLLDDAQQARKEAEWLDEPVQTGDMVDRIQESIHDLDPDDILPSQY